MLICFPVHVLLWSPAGANVCNVLLMRHSELSEGISVLDDSGKAVGTSRLAARHVSRTRTEAPHGTI